MVSCPDRLSLLCTLSAHSYLCSELYCRRNWQKCQWQIRYTLHLVITVSLFRFWSHRYCPFNLGPSQGFGSRQRTTTCRRFPIDSSILWHPSRGFQSRISATSKKSSPGNSPLVRGLRKIRATVLWSTPSNMFSWDIVALIVR
jgi:hypothetical protein